MIVSVVYPKSETSHFDHAYYMATHMPLVQKLWAHHGLKNATVMKGTGSLGGAPAYELITLLDFDSREHFLQAVGTHGDEVIGDVKNFTNIEPIIQFNDVVS